MSNLPARRDSLQKISRDACVVFATSLNYFVPDHPLKLQEPLRSYLILLVKRVGAAMSVCVNLRTYWGLSYLLLGGCAGISVQALDYRTGQPNGEAPGIRYYMPKPYLLVTELPRLKTTQKVTKTTYGKAQAPKNAKTQGGGQDLAKDGTSDSTKKKAPSDTGSGATPAATGTDTGSTQAAAGGSNTDLSYSAVVGNYQLKLIYLPDKSRPMAINMTPGLFGNVSAQPTLQDGWMLTSLQGSAVSDGSGALTAFASVVSALGGISGKGASTSSTASATKSKALASELDQEITDADLEKPTSREETVTESSSELLLGRSIRPGLYEFYYDDLGILRGLCRLSTFPDKLGTQADDRYACPAPILFVKG